MKYAIASSKTRLLAGLIDLFFYVGLFFIPLYFVSLSSTPFQFLDRSLLYLVLFLVFVQVISLFEVIMIVKFGGTLGKLLTGLSIVDSKNKTLSFWRAFFRNIIGHSVSQMFLSLGFIWILFDKERRGWHDMMADTRVIIARPQKGIFGVMILLLLVGISFVFVRVSILNLKNNSDLYVPLIDEIKTVFNSSKKDKSNGIRFTTIATGSLSSMKDPGNYFISSEKEWRQLLSMFTLKTIPLIDFSKQAVIAVFQGAQGTGGYIITINKIVEKENVLYVYLTTTVPGNCVVTQALTSPYHIVEIEKTEKEIRFIIEEETKDC